MRCPAKPGEARERGALRAIRRAAPSRSLRADFVGSAFVKPHVDLDYTDRELNAAQLTGFGGTSQHHY